MDFFSDFLQGGSFPLSGFGTHHGMDPVFNKPQWRTKPQDSSYRHQQPPQPHQGPVRQRREQQSRQGPVRREQQQQGQRREQPESKPAKIRVIPVHDAKVWKAPPKDLMPDEAAKRIQSAARGFAVRSAKVLPNLRKIAEVRRELEGFEAQVDDVEHMKVVRGNYKERAKLTEGVMRLLLHLDSIQGCPFVREARKATVKRIVCLQDRIDGLLQEKGEAAVEQKTETQKQPESEPEKQPEAQETVDEQESEQPEKQQSDAQETAATDLEQQMDADEAAVDDQQEADQDMNDLSQGDVKVSRGGEVDEVKLEDETMFQEDDEMQAQTLELVERMEKASMTGEEQQQQDCSMTDQQEAKTEEDAFDKEVVSASRKREREEGRDETKQMMTQLASDNQQLKLLVAECLRHVNRQSALLNQLNDRVQKLEKKCKKNKQRKAV